MTDESSRTRRTPDPGLLPKKFEQVAEGVYRLRGDIQGAMNIYFIAGPDGDVVQFDAGTRFMTKNNRKVAEAFGGIDRVVLGHAHADHRGTAPRLGVPVYVHPDEVADAESKAAINSYMNISELKFWKPRLAYPILMRLWNGGAVEVAGTVEEGDDVAGFKVFHFPGHAPGLIGLFRESDRVAIVSDVVYLVDSARLEPLPEGEASVPHPAWAWDHQKSKESVRKLAELKPHTVFPGHEDRLEGNDLTATLLDAADRY